MSLDDFGLHLTRLIAGLGGGLVAALGLKDREPKSIISSVVVGMLTANYLSDAVAHYVPPWIGTGGAAFLAGLLAMAIVQAIIAMAKRRLSFMVDRGEK